MVLEGIRKVGIEEGEGILAARGEDTILAGRHMAYLDIQGQEHPEDPEGLEEDHHGPSHQAEEGKIGDIERAVQMEDHPEGRQEEGLGFGLLVVLVVLVEFELGPVLVLAP